MGTGSILGGFVLALMLTSGQRAAAGPWLPKCQSAAKASDGQCGAAVKAFKAADKGREIAGKAASGTNVNSNSGIEQSAIQGNDADLQKAIGECQAAKKDCDEKCDSALKEAQAAMSDPNKMPIAKPDVAAIPGVKSGQCDQPIDSKLGELQAGKAPLGQQSKEAEKTKDESKNGGGGMPPMPTPPKSDPSDTGSTAAAATPAAAALNCAVVGGSRFSDCNAAFTTKCGASMTASECDAFADRYCALTSGDASTAPPAKATTNLVIDKRGEGTGTNFCSYALSYRYCQTAGREQCPSCLKVYAQASCGASAASCLAESSSGAMEKAKATCPDDPIFLTGGWSLGGAAGAATPIATPSTLGAAGSSSTSAAAAATAAALTSGTPASSILPASIGGGGAGYAGGGSFGGGGGRGLSGSGVASDGTPGAAIEGANREGLPNGIIAAGAAGGPGDQSGGSAWVNESEHLTTDAEVRRAFEGRRPGATGAETGLSTEVANSLGPSLFTVGSGGIKSFCAKNRLTSCAGN